MVMKLLLAYFYIDVLDVLWLATYEHFIFSWWRQRVGVGAVFALQIVKATLWLVAIDLSAPLSGVLSYLVGFTRSNVPDVSRITEKLFCFPQLFDESWLVWEIRPKL